MTNLGLGREVVAEAIRSAWLGEARIAPPPAVPEARVRALVASKFADPAWVERF